MANNNETDASIKVNAGGKITATVAMTNVTPAAVQSASINFEATSIDYVLECFEEMKKLFASLMQSG